MCISAGLLAAVMVEAPLAQETRFSFDIPAQEASSALIAFGEQANITVLLKDDVRNTKISGIVGSFTIEEAIQGILKHTNLVYRIHDDSIIVSLGDEEEILNGIQDNELQRDKKTITSSSLFAALAAALFSTSTPVAVTGQPADNEVSPVLEEVVVTARRREERLLDVPDAITVFGAQEIENSGIENVFDFAALTPNLTWTPGFRPGANFITVRGIATAQEGEPPITFIVDGVQAAELDFLNTDLVDIESIQVLKGPQGALYGRGSIGGAILINTKRPTNDVEGGFEFAYGNGDTFRGKGVVSGAIVEDKLFFRLSGAYREREGLLPILTVNEDGMRFEEYTITGLLSYKATDRLNFDWRIKHVNGEADGALPEFVIPPFMGIVATQSDFDDFSFFPNINRRTTNDRKLWETSLKVDYESGFGTFTSVTSCSDSKDLVGGDSDFGPFPFSVQDNTTDLYAINQDIRFMSPGRTTVSMDSWCVLPVS